MLIYIKIQLICYKVFVNVGHIIHGFPSDDLTGNFFYIKKPFVRVKASLKRFFANLINSGRTRMILLAWISLRPPLNGSRMKRWGF